MEAGGMDVRGNGWKQNHRSYRSNKAREKER